MALRSLPGAEITVMAAASMTDVLKTIAAQYEQKSANRVRLSFASSGALARQIDSGASADVYVSANKKWVDYLQQHERLLDHTIVELLGNHLVLIAPKSRPFAFAFSEGADLPAAFSGWLAVGDFKSVPVGMYAEEALRYYNWFDAFKSRYVLGDTTRRVLLFVEQGEVDAGIVYSTDAVRSDKVTIVAEFPEASHRPIRYYTAVCRDSEQPDIAGQFIEYLQSDSARAVFAEAGFVPLRDDPPASPLSVKE